MPPLYQDPLSAVPGAWRWLDLARALVEVSSEAWALALIALAVYSYLEVEVRGVLKVFLPLALGLAAAAALALAARALGGVPRPVDGAAHLLGPLLRRAFPSGHVAALAVFASYSALVYGRRAILAIVPAALVGVAHALTSAHFGLALAGGAALGLGLGAAAYGVTLRVSPDGYVAHRRGGRGPHPAPTGPGSP